MKTFLIVLSCPVFSCPNSSALAPFCFLFVRCFVFKWSYNNLSKMNHEQEQEEDQNQRVVRNHLKGVFNFDLTKEQLKFHRYFFRKNFVSIFVENFHSEFVFLRKLFTETICFHFGDQIKID